MIQSKSFALIASIPFALLAGIVNSQEADTKATFEKQVQQIEKQMNAQVSVSMLDMNNNQTLNYHQDKVLPMGCTSKVMGVAAILKMSQDQTLRLDERVYYPDPAANSWSPITKDHVKTGMTIKELAGAAIYYSDNTAMNLLTMKLKGPDGINAFARSIGDSTFNSTNWWPKEAYAGPSEGIDASSAHAMTTSLKTIIFGNVLEPQLKNQLKDWMISNKTGDARIRAGLPKGWIVGDKTGTGAAYGTTNDIAFFWPKSCKKPIIASIFYTNHDQNAKPQNDIIAKVTAMSVKELAKKVPCLKKSLTEI